MVRSGVVAAIAALVWLWPASACAEGIEWRLDVGCCGVAFDGGLRGIGLGGGGYAQGGVWLLPWLEAMVLTGVSVHEQSEVRVMHYRSAAGVRLGGTVLGPVRAHAVLGWGLHVVDFVRLPILLTGHAPLLGFDVAWEFNAYLAAGMGLHVHLLSAADQDGIGVSGEVYSSNVFMRVGSWGG